MTNFWEDAKNSPEPLTMKKMRAVFEADEKRRREAEQARAERYRNFYDSVPHHLRKHPLIAEMATIVGEGIISHPKAAASYRRRYDELVARGEV